MRRGARLPPRQRQIPVQTEPRREGAHTGTRRSRAHRRLRRAALAALALTLAAAGWFAWSLWLTRSPPSPELTRAERTAIPRDALDPSDLGGDLLAIAPPQEDERSRHAPATTRVLPALDTPGRHRFNYGGFVWKRKLKNQRLKFFGGAARKACLPLFLIVAKSSSMAVRFSGRSSRFFSRCHT